MIALLSALLIATSDTTPPCCRSASLLGSTTTEKSHRVGHIISPAIATASIYGGALYFGASKKQARIISVGASLAAVFAKELYDQHSAAHNFSWGDVGVGVASTGAGLLIAEKITWPEEKKSRQ